MSKIDLDTLTITKASIALHKKEYTALELTEAFLEHIARVNPDINAYLEVFAEDARISAKRADIRIAEGTHTPLTGIPLAIKDNMLLEGKIASGASKILSNYRATYTATAVAKLREAGAVILGRTNMDEFAMGGANITSAYGPVKNPRDTSRVPGGSSGGSAAAVAMGGALGALGSDTGGSIRQPASLCGVVGLKPTYGAVSRYGLMAMASSLDQIGPFALTVSDAELLFNAIRGYDSLDSTSIPDERYATPEQKKTLVIGVPEDFIHTEGVDPDVADNLAQAMEKYRALGYTIQPIKLPFLKYALAIYYIIMPAEVSTNLSRFDGIKYGVSEPGDNLMEVYRASRGKGFGKEARRRILLGTYVLSAGYYDAFYNKAVAVRRKLVKELEEAFQEVDLIAMPTSPNPAWKFGEKMDNPLQMYLADIFTVPANIAGVPAISFPSGTVVRDGVHLPVGLQLLAPAMHEQVLFRAGKDFAGE